MEFKKTVYVAEALILFTDADIELLSMAADRHYDGKCRETVKRGGVLYGLRNALIDGRVDTILKAGEVDILAKICENNPATREIGVGLRKTLQTLNEEYRRMNPVCA